MKHFVSMIRNVWLFVIMLHTLVAHGAYYNVVDMGAMGDGVTDSTEAFSAAWFAACDDIGNATVVVPPGLYLLNRVTFEGPCRSLSINVRIDGTLLASTNYTAYSDGYWLLFNRVQGVSILGGTIDGQGEGLWACKASNNESCPIGARSITFDVAKDIVINGLTSNNSQLYHIGFNNCENVTVQNVLVVAPDDSPNTDGIHVQKSTGITIVNSDMKTGDDCISIGPGTRDLLIENVTCGPGHGISIGSLAKDFIEEGVQNVTVKMAVFIRTQNGLRIKSWGRPSEGFVQDILFEDVFMIEAKYPIIIDQNYCPNDENCPYESSGVTIDRVTYRNVIGSSATEVAVKFDCSETNHCTGIVLENVKLTYQNTTAQSSCMNADDLMLGDSVDPAINCFNY